jgi:hypothetical protein
MGISNCGQSTKNAALMIWRFPEMDPQFMGNLIKIDDLGVPPFQEISISPPSKNVG